MDKSKAIGIKSVGNARQLGGYYGAEGKRVKDGLLLRSGHLAALSDEDINILSKKYSLERIIDLRTSAEQIGNDDKLVPGAFYEHVNIMDESVLGGSSKDISVSKDTPEGLLTFLKAVDRLNLFRDDMYIDFLEGDMGKKGYRRFFEILLSCGSDRAVLWHCASGKDRTGLAAMLILTALGADEKTIIEDYMLTNEFNRERIEKTREFILRSDCDDRLAENIAPFGGVHEKYMNNALEHLKKEYGSPLGYIKMALHVSDSEIDELKNKYLE